MATESRRGKVSQEVLNGNLIGIYSAHEQQTKMGKVVGGAIGILDNERALLEWALFGPYIAKMIKKSDYENLTSHHEDTDSYEKHFPSKHKLLIEAFCKFDNPFMNPSNGLMHIVSKEIMHDSYSYSYILILIRFTDFVFGYPIANVFGYGIGKSI